MMVLQRFRPMTLGDVFDEAFELYRKNFAFFLLVTAVTVVPLYIVRTVVAIRFLGYFAPLAAATGGVPDPMQVFNILGMFLGRVAVMIPISLLGYGLLAAGLAAATGMRYLGEPLTIWQAYRQPLRRILPLLLTTALYTVSLLAGLIVCYIGLLLPLTLFVFAAHAFAMENRAFGQALGRSYALVNGYGSRILGALILLSLLTGILSLAISAPIAYGLDSLFRLVPGTDSLLSGSNSFSPVGTRAEIIHEIGGGLAGMIVTPFSFCVLTVLYYDLRVRREAFDVERLAQELNYPPLPALSGYLPPVEAVLHPLTPRPGAVAPAPEKQGKRR